MSDKVISSSPGVSSGINKKPSLKDAQKHKLSDISSDNNVKRQKIEEPASVVKTITSVQDSSEDNTGDVVEEAELPQRDMKKIELLEKSIQDCLKKIKELEEEEVDWDEEEEDDSAYIKVDRYKRKLVELCKCLSKMNGDTSMRRQILKKKISRKDIPGEMTGDLSVDKAILDKMNSDLKKINKMKYLETQGLAQFVQTPEYLDVLKCIQECNTTNDLNFSEEHVNHLAKKAFLAIGNYLKKKRIEDTEMFIQFLLDENQNEDPATKDPELDKKLQQNRIQAAKKLEGVFTEFIKKEDDLKNEEMEKMGEGASKDDLESHTGDKDNTVGEPVLESSNTENSLVSKNSPNFIETSQVFADVNNDASVTNNDSDLGAVIAVEDSLDVEKLSGSKVPTEKAEANEINILSGSKLPTIKTEITEMMQLDIEASSNTITENLAEVTRPPTLYNKSQRNKLKPIVIDLTEEIDY